MIYFEILKKACEDVEISFNEQKYKMLMDYKELLKEWNEKINLTAITDDEGIVKKHFIDCIKAFKAEEFKMADKIIDVGTGAGFPGLVLAIMREDMEVTLLDSLNKRINFLNQVVSTLGLKNVLTIHSRAEDGARRKDLREIFDIATSRAVANMAVLSELCIPYVKVGGSFIALKGPAIDEEMKDASKAIDTLGGQLDRVIKVEIEDTDLNHNVVIVKKLKNTSKVYPRKAGTINKKPIK